ncbi:MAG: DUF2806 domain-containing protein, partial [Betaproteobacteria bacterium]|nr:DUF2806 domain-containing protein [Betaproteobacteria bacterium]
MTDLPATPKLPAIAKWAGIRNIARSVGRFVISQSEAVSEAIARHELRLAQVQALKDLMKADAAIVAKEKAKLVAKFAKGDAAERITIRRDIDELEGLFRRLHVYQQATNHLLIEAADVPKEGAEPKALDVPPIAESWLDRFDQLARAANEQWRSELLSQALAREAVQPGSIGTRALWFIGTIDERGFRHFATIADMCMHIGGEGEFGVAIPAIQGRLPFELAVPTSTPDPNLTIGEACFEISDLGLISDVSASSFR